MKIFDAESTRGPLDFERLIPALKRAFAQPPNVPARHVHAIGGESLEGTLLIMPAWSQDLIGIKTIAIYPANAARGLPGLHATYQLFDATTGVPLALMDGDQITARRTAAAAALGASFLARADARRLTVLGTGRIARLLPEAFASVRPVDEVRVWNHRHAGAVALAAQWQDQGLRATAVASLEEAVRGADIVSCATLSNEPLVQADWLAPGSHLDLIGSFTPRMREAHPACFDGARCWVDTDEALHKSGDLLDAFAAGMLARENIAGTLQALCTGQARGRQHADERTVFKAVGNALEDLAAARLVWQDSQHLQD